MIAGISMELHQSIFPTVVGRKLIRSWKRQQSVLCKKKKKNTSLPPYNRTHISRYPTFNIWGSVRKHQVIMFESNYTAFTHYKCKKLSGQIAIEHASEISITLLKLAWIRAVIICILCLEWWMAWGVSSAQHTYFSGTLEVCTYPQPVYPLCLWTTSQESVGLSDGLNVWECVGMTTWFTLSKKKLVRYANIFSSLTELKPRF